MQIEGLNVSHSLLTGHVWPQAEVRFRSMFEEAGFLRQRINEYSSNLALRELALKIVFPACPARDEACQALTIGEWVQEHITYVHENRELFQSPQTTLRLGAGDCDDMTVLIDALLGSLGLKNKAVFLRVEGHWVHIFPLALVKVPGEPVLHRMTLDATLDQPIRELTNPIELVQDTGRSVAALFV